MTLGDSAANPANANATVNTDYVVRSTSRANHRATRYTVVDIRGIIHHVTITDRALYDGHGDTVIRASIAHAARIIDRPKEHADG